MSLELLAPAGNFDCIEAACIHGADAVYIGGGTLNLRAHSRPFSHSDIALAVTLVHGYEKKLYVALNAMPGESELPQMEELLKYIAQKQTHPDAFIVSDPGVIELCKEIIPHVPLHLSTQTGTANSKSIAFWKKQGIFRFVLPRELTLQEIEQLSKDIQIETEVFVHGAMCMAISGRCLMSAYMHKRHPNKGDCAQPCRLAYSISPVFEHSKPDTLPQSYHVECENQTSYIMNSKDLNTLSILPHIVATGVRSLKIEGRNKSVNYVSSVVRVYRQALIALQTDPQNYAVKQEWVEELDAVDHRPYTTGFFAGEYELQALAATKAADSARMVGMVKENIGENKYIIDVKNPFVIHEKLTLIPVQFGKNPFEVEFSSITDFKGRTLESAKTNRLAIVTANYSLRAGDILRR